MKPSFISWIKSYRRFTEQSWSSCKQVDRWKCAFECVYKHIVLNSYRMRLSMISRFIPTEVTVVLLYIQNSDRCKKRFAVKRLVRLTFQATSGLFCCFVIFAVLKWLRHLRPIILFFGQLRRIIHDIRRKWCHYFRTLRINWWMSISKKQERSLNV